ncbi:MAG: hypothetical protein H6861_03775 [Rhodospirillales bacterium]|nr:hypothetical protein [Rhodospirillales bacterium]
MRKPFSLPPEQNSEHGNVLFIILLAIVLIGALTAAIQSSNRSEGSNIDAETLVIRASEVQRYASELERAVTYIMHNGKSESDIRFAHPDAHSDYGDLSADADPSDQVFHGDGGAASYRAPPSGINDGSAWEFYGGTHIPGMGTTSRAELIAVLPNVTQDFCDRINTLNGQPLITPDPPGPPEDTGAATASGLDPGNCLAIGALGRFDNAQQFYSIINSVDEASFTQDPNTGGVRPAPQACVKCAVGSAYHFYHVLLAR